METNNIIQDEYKVQIEKLLDKFMFDMYKGHDHIVARKYFRDLFSELIPKYFCICEPDKSEIEPKIN